jgi:hypothetical protein
LWSGQPGSWCTCNSFYGCFRVGTSTNMLNPIVSSRIRYVLQQYIPRIRPFFIPDRIQNFFHSGSYMKSGRQTYFFLASLAFKSKVLVLAIVKKIRDPGSGKNSSRIQWVKKLRVPDPQHCPTVLRLRSFLPLFFTKLFIIIYKNSC